ncbi:hypothetical protein [Arthrobacter sp. HLT1-20]
MDFANRCQSEELLSIVADGFWVVTDRKLTEIMPDDPIREELHTELRALRRGFGVFGEHRLTELFQIIDFVGEGSVEHAFTVLVDLAAQHGGDSDGDIRAYFESCGLETPGDTLDARLATYASTHFVDARTARRRSDRGANQLSHIIRDRYIFERPFGNLFVSQRETRLLVGISIGVPEHSAYRRPRVTVDGEYQDHLKFELHESSTPLLLCADEKIEVILDRANEVGGEPLTTIGIYWVMPVWPTWQLGAHMSDPKLFSKISIERNNSVLLTVLPVL